MTDRNPEPTWFTGDDNRDELAPRDPDCWSCGAGADEDCDEACDCEFCVRKRLREREAV